MEREEAINIVRKNIPHLGLGATEMTEALESLIPELRENEDERIYRIIYGAIQYCNHIKILSDKDSNDVLAYLEKQKEQKPDDVKREWWNKGYLEGRKNAHIPARELGLPSSWDFQKEQKPAPDWMPKFLDELRSKKNYFDWDEHRDIEGHILAIINWIDPNYFDGKEKEQKSAEKQDYSGLTDFERAIHRGFLCAGVVNVPVAIIKETAQECMAKIKPVEWSVEDETQRINTIIFLQTPVLRKVYQQSQVDKAVEWLRNLCPQPKQEWSKEDEKMLEAFLHKLEVCDILTNKEVMWAKHRLKSLSPQPKQEWSEDDKQWLESIIREYEKRLSVDKDHAAVIQVKIDLLKSLRPSWKPSEEQMDVLLSTIKDKHNAARFYSLSSLYNDLKKL